MGRNVVAPLGTGEIGIGPFGIVIIENDRAFVRRGALSPFMGAGQADDADLAAGPSSFAYSI
ncbi:hypothetical protein [Sphingobium vermicomposti]|uniref:Uncharacterized protein n=1 Tax=Sphingobium vermicomposti TaxID=529005 RepID=A0A846MFZ9_9SPHN|nr:hypothetical protein [Sphingobium vermicomposti]NIJ15636.1 hypothetical protein [Sphingobium vermicomposti]